MADAAAAAAAGPAGASGGGGSGRLKKVLSSQMLDVKRDLAVIGSLKSVKSEFADLRNEARQIFAVNPAQSVKTLADATLTCALIQVFVVCGWLVYFGTRDWDVATHPGSKANTLSNSARDTVLIVGMVMEAIALITVVWGSQGRNVNALLMGHVAQLGMLSLVHIGYDHDGVRFFAFFADLFILGGAWAVMRQHEMEQSFKHEKQGNEPSAKLVERLVLPLYAVGLLNLAAGIAIAAVGGIPFNVARGIIQALVAVCSIAAGVRRNRRLHNLLYMLHIVMATFTIGPLSFAVQKVSNQELVCQDETYQTDATANLENCQAAETAAGVHATFTIISAFSTLVGAFLHTRLSALIQDLTREAEKPWLFGMDMKNPIATVRNIIHALTPIQIVLGVVFFVQSAGYDSDALSVEVGMGGYSYTMGTAMIVAAIVGAVAAKKESLTFIPLSYTMQEALLSVGFLGLAYAGNVIVANSTDNVPPIETALAIDQAFLVNYPVSEDQESKFTGSIIVASISVVTTTIYGFFLFDLHEFIQDKHKNVSYHISEQKANRLAGPGGAASAAAVAPTPGGPAPAPAAAAAAPAGPAAAPSSSAAVAPAADATGDGDADVEKGAADA